LQSILASLGQALYVEIFLDNSETVTYHILLHDI